MKLPVFEIEPLIDSYYITQAGNKKITFKERANIQKSLKSLKKSIKEPLTWIFIKHEDREYPVLMKKTIEGHLFLTGSLRLKKAKTEKDLEYWKKKLLDALKDEPLEKSLGDILFLNEVPKEAEEMLQKARSFPVGTIRTWSGKRYKKVPSGKWSPVAETKIITDNKNSEEKKQVTYEEMDDTVEKFLKDNRERLKDKYVAIRYDNKKVSVGDALDYSKSNIEREDEREFPEYGTEEYKKMGTIEGTSVYSLNNKEDYSYSMHDDEEIEEFFKEYGLGGSGIVDQKGSQYNHASIVVGDLNTDPMVFAEDEGEVVLENAEVAKILW